MKARVRRWLEEGTVDVFIGYRQVDGHPLPYCFTRENLDALDGLINSPARYALEKIATHLAARQPDLKIGILSLDTNRRALNVLGIWNQINPENITTVDADDAASGVATPDDMRTFEPVVPGPYKQQVGIDNAMSPADAEAFDQSERFSRWMYEFEKCIKCYGCRNICPVCFCRECSLEHRDLIGTGPLPPDVPIFHLVRAVHMAGRCIDCGLCEEACPADISLRLLYRKVNQILDNVFEYQTGSDPGQPPFSLLGNQVTLEPKPLDADK